MSDSARDLLVRGIAAAKAKEKDQARFYLEWVLRTDADREQKIKAWLWLTEVSDDPAEKREYLENILAHEPSNALARRGMALLKGQLKPEDIIDPNRLPDVAAPASPEPAHARRFVCQQCGGKLAFSPNGQSLICTYCDRHLTLYQAIQEGAMVEEQDFAVALATARGHSHPVSMQALYCQGCGASFVLGPNVLSLSCPYCASAHVVKVSETRDLIPPEGIIPFQLTQAQASAALEKWLQEKNLRAEAHLTPPEGVYLPVWTFDVGGEAQWTGKTYEKHYGRTNLVAKTGAYPVFYDNVLVAASHMLPRDLSEEIKNFELGALLPYEPGYLADWPAEIYQVTVSDASLAARHQVWGQARRMVETRSRIHHVRELAVSSAGMVIESFKLILLPFWLTHYRYTSEDFPAAVNGQTGHVRARRPRSGLGKWLANLLDGE